MALDGPRISVSPRGSTNGQPDCTVVWVRGEHDITTKVPLVDTIARAAQLDDLPILVDLAAVTFMDASTIGAIVESRNRLQARGQRLEMRAPSPPARRLLELCGLTHLVRREPVHAIGPAAALGTWIDVVPAEPIARGARVQPPASRMEAWSKQPSMSKHRSVSDADRGGR